MRMRLNDAEAIYLGINPKPKQKSGNPKYQVTKNQSKLIKEYRKAEIDTKEAITNQHSGATIEEIEESIKTLTSIFEIAGQSKIQVQKWLVLPDYHRPFHNVTLEHKILQLIKDLNGNLYGINIAGDFLDLYTLGSYNAESLGLLQGISLEYEYKDGLKGIKSIEEAAHKDIQKQFLFGNHEDRYFREVNKKDNAKYGNALKNPIEALELDERGWQVKTNWKDDFFTLGKYLDIMHGMYTNIHAAYKHLQMTHNSVMFGHTHRIQSYNSGDKASYNIGTLCDINNKAFNYMPRLQKNVWANGFAIVNIDDNGCYFVEQINVWNNSFFYNGKMY